MIIFNPITVKIKLNLNTTTRHNISHFLLLIFQAFKFFPKDRKMALVQLPTVDDSIASLVQLHNYQLSETSHLR